MRSTDLEGRTALVLGAAGELGRAAAATLATLGARVVVADENAEGLRSAFAEDDRFAVRPIAPDDGTLPRLAEEFPETDVLVHCPDAGVEAESLDSAAAAGACLGAIQHFSPAMARRRGGSIITLTGRPRRACAARHRGLATSSRGPVAQMVSTLASELQPYGVRVNAVVPVGVAPTVAVAFLASDASRHTTGSMLTIEDGWSAMERLHAAPPAPPHTLDDERESRS